jgi:DNA primase
MGCFAKFGILDRFFRLGYNHAAALTEATRLGKRRLRRVVRQMELSTRERGCGMDFAHLDAREPTLSFASPLDSKEQVRQATDIVDLVGKYIQLRRLGRNYVGLCPWHDDTKPSLQVNPERQSFKCWVCDIGGDVFSFMMQMEGVDFREALELLADQSGITLQPLRQPEVSSVPLADGEPAPAPIAPTSGEGKRALYRAMAWAEQQYHQCLLDSEDAEPARRYLQERGITEESIRKFHIGFAPMHRDWLLNLAGGSSERAQVLETVGVLARSQDSPGYYDRFRGRLLFSIRDTQDRAVGIGGRILPESGLKSKAKYVNSPETPLFTKNKLLYGLDVAHKAIRDGKPRTVLVMEGFTDCIMAHQFGFENAVAVLGTALGPNHVKLLKRFADRIVLILDGDEAGQRRTNEVLELFIAENVDLRILTLPTGSDPCEFLMEHGQEAFADLLETRAVDALEHAFRSFTHGIDLVNDVHASSEALEKMVAILAKAPQLRADSSSDGVLRMVRVLTQVAQSFRVPEEEVRRRLTSLRRASAQRPVYREEPEYSEPDLEMDLPVGKITPLERELLEILLRRPELLAQAREHVQSEQIAFSTARLVFAKMCGMEDEGITPSFDRLMLEFEDARSKAFLVDVDEGATAKETENPEALLDEWIRRFKRREEEKQFPTHTATLREGGLDESQETELFLKMLEQQRARHGISKPTDG